jgi:hypothetical protein
MMLIIKNNIKKIALLSAVSVSLLITGCRKQLDITPETFIAPDQLYKDEAGDIAGVTGIYRKMLELKSSDYYFIGIVGTDEGKTTSFVPTWGGYWTNYAGINSYNNLLTGQNDLVQGVWNSLYKGISNANVAIRFIPGSSASEEVKSRLIGEAKFLRAAFYFYLVQLFGGVPMPTDAENAKADENGGYTRSSEDDVYALIIADLQYASEHLHSKGASGSDVGHANKEAAMTLLGKVYLTRKDFTNAKTTLEPLMSATNVRLMDNYADLFKEVNENNIESLFEVGYTNENGNTNSIANTVGGWQIPNTYPGGGGNVVLPTDYYDNIFESGDERRDASIRFKFYDASGAEVDWWWWADAGKPRVKKYDITAGKSVNGGLSSRNLYYLRYSDAILMYAEAQNELNDVAGALTSLNKIRTRAKLAGWETVLGHAPSQSEFRDEILKERMRELGFEGWRWFDLKRTGKLLSQTKAYNVDATANMSDKHLLYPLPAREFETNAALKPSDQNPGY